MFWQVIICCEKLRMGCSRHCRMFNSIPWPVTSKDISSIPYPSCDKQKCHQALLTTSKGQTSPDWESLVYPRNSMERGAWRATIHGVAKSQTWLSDFHIHSTYKVTSQTITYFKVYSLCFQISYPWISEFPMRVIATFYHFPFSDKNLLGTCILNHFSHVRLFVTLWTVARQPALSLGFSRQKFWRELICPFPGDLPDPGMEPAPLMSNPH